MDAIKIIGLTKRYKDVTAVNNLSLTVNEGELISLLGTNGAGKTTTIKMLSCLTAPSEGEALLMGKSIRTEPFAVKEIIASSPQETAIAPGLSVKENLEFIAGVYGYNREKQKEKASEIVDLTWHKFEYKGETLTQIECIDRMIEGCKLYIQDSEPEDKEKQEKIKSVAEIWAMVLPAMWW